MSLSDLEALNTLCTEVEKKLTATQDDSTLINLLSTEYAKLSKAALNKILAEVQGKKSADALPKTEQKKLENRVIGESFILGINPLDKNGDFIGIKKLKHRIALKKTKLKKA